MFEYLQPADRPVVDGLEEHEVVYARDQAQYNPLRTLRAKTEEVHVMSRWTLTPEQRQAVADGADIFLTLLTFGSPLQPIMVAVSDKPNADYFAHAFNLVPEIEGEKTTLQFICDGGKLQIVECNDEANLAFVLVMLGEQGQLTGNPLRYEVRNCDGVLLDLARRVGDLKQERFGQTSALIPDVWRLFVSLPAGIGG